MTIIKTNRFERVISVLFSPIIKFSKLSFNKKLLIMFVLALVLVLVYPSSTLLEIGKTLKDVFLTLLKSPVPLIIFTGIVTAICTSEINTIIKIGKKVMFFIILFGIIGATAGMVTANIMHVSFGEIDSVSSTSLSNVSNTIGQGTEFKVTEYLVSMIPPSFLDMFLDLKYALALIAFSAVFGIFLLKLGKESVLSKGMVELNKFVTYMVDLIIKFTPYGIFGIVITMIGGQDWEEIKKLFSLLAIGVPALFLLYAVLPAISLIMVRLNPLIFYKKVSPASLFSFFSASSVATIQITEEATENMGVSKSNRDFTIYIGATMNMVGTAFCLSMYTVMGANQDSLELIILQYFLIAIISITMAIGIAGVPSASLFMLAFILSIFGIDPSIIITIAITDRIFDMCRTSINVTFDALIAVIVDKLNGKLDEKQYNLDSSIEDKHHHWSFFYKNRDLIFYKIRSFFHAIILK